MSAWAFLTLAIAFEIVGTLFLKLSDGFANWRWGLLAMACYGICFPLLAPAMKTLPVGVIYAIWAGVGILAAALIGLLAFDERLSALQLLFMVCIIVGAVGLRLVTRV